MSSRTWIKVYCDKWLEGTISEESISVRGVWISLLALAGNGKYGDSGYIKAIDSVGFNDIQLASILKINQKMWGIAKKRLLKTGRITSESGNIIAIINWKKYQSEYERTSKYRRNDTTNDTTNDTAREDRGERKEDRGKRIDNTILAQSNILDNFNTFWGAYPKKKSKGQAEKAFEKVNPDNQLLVMMLESIDKAMESVDWLKDDGKFIPYPATWLNARGWEDEYTAEEVDDKPIKGLKIR